MKYMCDGFCVKSDVETLHRAGLFLPHASGPGLRGGCVLSCLCRGSLERGQIPCSLSLFSRGHLQVSRGSSALSLTIVCLWWRYSLPHRLPCYSESANEPRASATQRQTDLQETQGQWETLHQSVYKAAPRKCPERTHCGPHSSTPHLQLQVPDQLNPEKEGRSP